MANPLESLMETARGQRLMGGLCAALGALLCALCVWLHEARGEVFPSAVFLGPFALALGSLIALFPGRGRGAAGELDRPACGLFFVAGVASLVVGVWFLDSSGFGLGG